MWTVQSGCSEFIVFESLLSLNWRYEVGATLTRSRDTVNSENQAAQESPRELDEARVERRERDEPEAKPIIVRHNGREMRLTQDPDGDLVRADQLVASAGWYLQRRLPTGMKQLPVDRCFDAMAKTKLLKQYSSATQTLAPEGLSLSVAQTKERQIGSTDLSLFGF
jgi:hypothetical protein